MLMKKLFFITPVFIIVMSVFVCFNYKTSAASLSSDLKGRILLQVQSHGEAWYINPADQKKYYLGKPQDAFTIMQNLGQGITNNNLAGIPIDIIADKKAKDSDSDGLSDDLEKAIGTDLNKPDTDGDGFKDRDEVTSGNDPLSKKKLAVNNNLINANLGKIFLQVESKGQAWYVNPVNKKRYFLNRPADAFGAMRSLGLGISNENIHKITTANNPKLDVDDNKNNTPIKDVNNPLVSTSTIDKGNINRATSSKVNNTKYIQGGGGGTSVRNTAATFSIATTSIQTVVSNASGVLLYKGRITASDAGDLWLSTLKINSTVGQPAGNLSKDWQRLYLYKVNADDWKLYWMMRLHWVLTPLLFQVLVCLFQKVCLMVFTLLSVVM